MNRPYTLTLTKSERDAIDWIGGRYSHGTELRNLLEHHEVTETGSDETEYEYGWDLDENITFHIPEHVAWEIDMLLEQDEELACFSEELKFKLLTFCHNIV